MVRADQRRRTRGVASPICRTSFLLAVIIFVGGCGPATAPLPTVAPSQTGLGDAVLSIDSRGGPAVIVKVGMLEAAHVGCSGSAVLTPGVNGLPPLPWVVTIVRESDSKVLLTSTVANLPQWLVMFGDDASLSSSPVLGPQGPPCASGP